MSDSIFLRLFLVFGLAVLLCYGRGVKLLRRRFFSFTRPVLLPKEMRNRLDLVARWGMMSFVFFAFMRLPGGWLTVAMGSAWVGSFVSCAVIGLKAVSLTSDHKEVEDRGN